MFDRLANEKTIASPATIFSRVSFLTNIFKGSNILSAFQLAQGYSPSIAGIPPAMVPQQLLDAHVELAAARALHKTMKARPGQTVSPAALHKGMRIWAFYDTSKQNDRKRCIEAKVISADQHFVKCRRSKKCPPMTVAYEHVRIAPKSEFVKELMEKSF